MSLCSLNDKLHSSFSLNSAVAIAVGKGLCLWFEVFFYLMLFLVMRKVLSQQFSADQRA